MKPLLLLILASSSLMASYLPPVEGSQLFRRDAIALDADRQYLLAQTLTELATRTSAMSSPKERRATAQLLAIAAQLVPEERKPAELNEMFQQGNQRALSLKHTEGHLNELSKIVRHLLEYKGDASSSQKLAHLILDPLCIIAPDLPVTDLQDPADEKQRWANSVAPLRFFKDSKK